MFAGQPVDNTASAERRRHLHEMMNVGDYFADHGGITAERMRAHGRERRVGGLRRDDGEELAFVGHIERIEAEKLQAAATSGFTGSASSSMRKPTFDCCASSLSVAASPPRVGSRMTRKPDPAAVTIAATMLWRAHGG